MKQIQRPWFEFKGARNSEMGALMVNMPVRMHPVMQGSKQQINGRDGFMFVSSNSYAPITITQDIVVPNASDIPKVMSWLTGKGDLRFFDSAGYAYEAMIITSFKRQNVTKRLEGQKMTITWTCQPFRHAVSEASMLFTEARSFSGMGDVNAKPLLKLEGNGTAELTINGDTFICALSAREPLYLDCDAGIAYIAENGEKLFAGQNVTIAEGSDWFELVPHGMNVISEMKNIQKLTITPKWRWF